jgi:hypothetical protein
VISGFGGWWWSVFVYSGRRKQSSGIGEQGWCRRNVYEDTAMAGQRSVLRLQPGGLANHLRDEVVVMADAGKGHREMEARFI